MKTAHHIDGLKVMVTSDEPECKSPTLIRINIVGRATKSQGRLIIGFLCLILANQTDSVLLSLGWVLIGFGWIGTSLLSKPDL
jgi:hypothetical protein